MMLRSGKRITKIRILFNISRSKGDLTMKLDQIIQQKIRNVFFKNYTQMVKKLLSDTFINSQS